MATPQLDRPAADCTQMWRRAQQTIWANGNTHATSLETSNPQAALAPPKRRAAREGSRHERQAARPTGMPIRMTSPVRTAPAQGCLPPPPRAMRTARGQRFRWTQYGCGSEPTALLPARHRLPSYIMHFGTAIWRCLPVLNWPGLAARVTPLHLGTPSGGPHQGTPVGPTPPAVRPWA